MTAYSLSARQRGYADLMSNMASARYPAPKSRAAAILAIACSGAESSLTNWENQGLSTDIGRAEHRQLNDAERTVARRSKGLGDGPAPSDNLDSMGLFAQRPMSGWGAPEDIMRPEYAIGKFFEALDGVADWDSMTQGAAILKVQGFYSDIYTPWLETAEQIVNKRAFLPEPDRGDWFSTLTGGNSMAGVGVWFVGYDHVLYACNTVTLTYRAMSNMDRVDAMRRQLDKAGIPWADWPDVPASMEDFGTDIGLLEQKARG